MQLILCISLNGKTQNLQIHDKSSKINPSPVRRLESACSSAQSNQTLSLVLPFGGFHNKQAGFMLK